MNDFTKEQLEEIQYLIQDREYMHGEFGRHNLGQKIQSMIDNYSEIDQELAEIKKQLEGEYNE